MKAEPVRLRRRVFEQRAADSPPHRRGQYPKMIKMRSVRLARQNIKSNRTLIFDGDICDVRRDEFRTHRERIPPGCDPSFWITPMPFRSVRDFSERLGVF